LNLVDRVIPVPMENAKLDFTALDTRAAAKSLPSSDGKGWRASVEAGLKEPDPEACPRKTPQLPARIRPS
jgi:hypothetical protein